MLNIHYRDEKINERWGGTGLDTTQSDFLGHLHETIMLLRLFFDNTSIRFTMLKFLDLFDM